MVKKFSSISSFAYWRVRNATKIGSLCSISASASSTSYNELLRFSSFFEKFTINSSMCLFVALVLRHSASAAVHNLLAAEAFDQELHHLCENTEVWILLTFPSCIHCWLLKAVQKFLWSIIDEALYFCKNKHQLKLEQQQSCSQSSVL